MGTFIKGLITQRTGSGIRKKSECWISHLLRWHLSVSVSVWVLASIKDGVICVAGKPHWLDSCVMYAFAHLPLRYINTQYISYDLVVNNPQSHSSILCWGELNLGILMSMSAAAFRRCLTLASRQGWGVRQTSNSTAVQAEVKSIVSLLFCRFFILQPSPMRKLLHLPRQFSA